METQHLNSLRNFVSQIEDPRIERQKLHLLEDILMLSIMAVICSCEGWEEIELFGKAKIEFLKEHLSLPNGIPSHDTIRRVFIRINPKIFEKMFAEWVDSIATSVSQEVISIDGKTVRRSQDEGKGKKAIHLVSAWANANQLVLGQLKVEDKTNEITAIPQLLDLIDIEDSIVTIDAMGCQKDIVGKIITARADYLIAVKDNQSKLFNQVQHSFSLENTPEIFEKTEKDHGRIETRKCSVLRTLKWIENPEKWSGLKSIVRIESRRQIGEKIQEETRFYISSLVQEASVIAHAARAHWGIENSLHWSLDVTFAEDQSRKRTGYSDQNFAIIRKIALNLLKTDKTVKVGIKGKRLKAGWDNDYLLKILKI